MPATFYAVEPLTDTVTVHVSAERSSVVDDSPTTLVLQNSGSANFQLTMPLADLEQLADTISEYCWDARLAFGQRPNEF